MTWYSTGNVTLTQGSNVITATGSSFLANVRVGDMFLGPVMDVYEISGVQADGQLQIAKEYAGESYTGTDWSICPTSAQLKVLAKQVADLVAIYQDIPAAAQDADAAKQQAQVYRNEAVAARDAALGAQGAAEVWRNEAVNAASAAATSESNATASRADAQAAAASAAGSATAASGSASTATTKASDASASATAAATSATNAGTKATEAAASAADALASKNAAAGSEASVAANASTATTKASEAAASASTASTKAGEASASASTASTKASEAAASATAALGYRDDAQAIKDSMTASAVTSVAGRTGAVVLAKTDVGLGNVDNLSRASILASPAITGTPTGITKTHVGLGNVDNTSDAGKPISTAAQSALDAKAPLASPTFTGTPIAPTPATGTNTTQVATAALVKATGDLKVAKAGDTMTGTLTGTGYISSNPGSGGLRFTTYAMAGALQYNVVWEANTGYPTSMYALHNPGVSASVNIRLNTIDTFVFYNNGGANKTGGGSWGDTSDARTKDDIADWGTGLDAVLALRVRQWRFKPETGRDTGITYRGLVAQEAEIAAPTLVRKQKGALGSLEFDDLRTVDPSDLPYILVNAVKTLAARLDSAEAEITALRPADA